MSTVVGRSSHQSGNPNAVHAGDFVFFGAVRGVDETGEVHAGVEEQAHAIFDQIELTLLKVGADLTHLVRVGVFFLDLQGDRPSFDRVWKARLTSGSVARYAVEAQDFGAPDGKSKILVEAVAHVPAA